jgi:hypothetical protein
LAAEQRLRALDAELTEERRRLAAERKRLERESARLADWERAARIEAPSAPRQTSFDKGLRRLADGGARRRSRPEASW